MGQSRHGGRGGVTEPGVAGSWGRPRRPPWRPRRRCCHAGAPRTRALALHGSRAGPRAPSRQLWPATFALGRMPGPSMPPAAPRRRGGSWGTARAGAPCAARAARAPQSRCARSPRAALAWPPPSRTRPRRACTQWKTPPLRSRRASRARRRHVPFPPWRAALAPPVH